MDNYEIKLELQNQYDGKFRLVYHCSFLTECENLINKFYPFGINLCCITDLNNKSICLFYEDEHFFVSASTPFYFTKKSKSLFTIKKVNF